MLQLRNLLVAAALVAVVGANANGTIYEQAYDGTSSGAVAQDFTDFPTFSSFEFDDFMVSDPQWNIKKVTIYGLEQGNPNFNIDARLVITQNPSMTAPGTVYHFDAGGVLAGNNLEFNVPFNLTTGAYYIGAWVTRPFSGGGQWYWLRTTPVSGGEHWFHNPGGGFGFGSNPVPGTVVFNSAADLAFKIEGTVVPEPASMIALLGGLAGMGLRRIRRN